MIVVPGIEARLYPHVSDNLCYTDQFPDLCTFTVDGEFAFVFCHLGPYDDVLKYILETNSNVENITFWSHSSLKFENFLT